MREFGKILGKDGGKGPQRRHGGVRPGRGVDSERKRRKILWGRELSRLKGGTGSNRHARDAALSPQATFPIQDE